jgi:hypothetical protein
MKSNALPSFWGAYRGLDKAVKRQAKKAYKATDSQAPLETTPEKPGTAQLPVVHQYV